MIDILRSLRFKVLVVWILTSATYGWLLAREHALDMFYGIGLVWYSQLISLLPAWWNLLGFLLWLFAFSAFAGICYAAYLYTRLKNRFKRPLSRHQAGLIRLSIVLLSLYVVAKNLTVYFREMALYTTWYEHPLVSGVMLQIALYCFNSYDLILALALIWQVCTPDRRRPVGQTATSSTSPLEPPQD